MQVHMDLLDIGGLGREAGMGGGGHRLLHAVSGGIGRASKREESRRAEDGQREPKRFSNHVTSPDRLL
jgi:hypothetical protein